MYKTTILALTLGTTFISNCASNTESLISKFYSKIKGTINSPAKPSSNIEAYKSIKNKEALAKRYALLTHKMYQKLYLLEAELTDEESSKKVIENTLSSAPLIDKHKNIYRKRCLELQNKCTELQESINELKSDLDTIEALAKEASVDYK